MTPDTPVAEILDDDRIVWIPIKHYSPVCAAQTRRILQRTRPAAVLVEGPDDATSLIGHILDSETAPPITVLSSYVDTRNLFGQNGILSPSESVPARFRGWWPLVVYSPEYQALRTGAELGADLRFIDAPLKASIPFHHVRARQASQVVTDRLLAESAYFEALRIRQRRRSFESFWAGNFEVGGLGTDPDTFRRSVLTFAWCTRNAWTGEDPRSFEEDGTALREAHMRWHIDAALKDHPSERIAVVTGAFHTVALPWTRKKRAKARADRNTQTLLCAHSHRALSSLYGMNRLPAWGTAVWASIETDAARPFDDAAVDLNLRIMRSARERGLPVSTADSVGAHRMAHNLAVLRRNREITCDDLLDAVQSVYVKGELGRDGGLLLDCAREVLIGDRQGRVTPAAGQVPLIRSFYADCKRHRIDVSGAARTVRCDVHKQERHRLKSAFLHQCAYLDIPIFGRLPERYWRSERLHYSGPDLATGTDMHLIAESWAVQWSEAVDDRLVELCDRGPTLARAAESTLWSAIQAGTTDASLASKLLLRSAQMGLVDLFDDALEVVDQALIADTHFEHLVISLGDFVVLHQYRDAVPTRGHQRVARTIAVAFQRACLRLPAIRHTPDSASRDSLDRLQELVRITLSCEAVDLDRVLLVEKLRELVVDAEGQPMIRGAGLGILYSLGAVREGVLVRELDGYLRGSPTRVGQTGAFLEGVFATAKSLVMGSPRLLRAMDQVLRRMEWETFKRILPDLRRAFTQFIPTEIDQISRRVAEEIGLDRVSRSDAPAPEALVRLAAGADRRAAEVLGTWLRDEPIASEETRAEEIGHR